MAITPMFFGQIEKFQCLKSSTTQYPDHGTLRRPTQTNHQMPVDRELCQTLKWLFAEYSLY